MAITPRAVGAWAASNATTQTVTLPTHATGDMLIVRTIRKPFTNPDDTVINTAGWAAVAPGVANGSTANGVGVGSMGFKAFWKVATSASETNPVVTWGTTSAPGAAVGVSYQNGGLPWETPVGNGGGDATARTSQTSTIASHISVAAGDLVDFFRGQCDDSGALTVPTITQTGVTYDTVTEYPATALLSSTSNDIAADGGYRTATAGTSSAAAVVTGTSAASEQHGAWMTRLRTGNYTGSGGVTFAKPGLSATGTSILNATGSGGVAFAKPSLAGTGSEVMTGTGAIAIQKPSLAGTGSETISGTGGIAFQKPTLAATGEHTEPQGPTGSGGVVFGRPSFAGSGALAISGSGGVAFAKAALAAAGAESMSGSGGVTFVKPTLSGTGGLTVAGSGGVTWARPSLAGSGTQSIPISGSGGVTFAPPSLYGRSRHHLGGGKRHARMIFGG